MNSAAPEPDHVLIVDDDVEIRTLLADQFGAAGYAVSQAGDGRQMMRVVAEENIDLVVLDLNLPGEDGLTLCRTLTHATRIPVIMLTARGDPLDRIIGLEMGADDYMPKPFEPRELLARVKSVLRRSRQLPVNLTPVDARRALFAGWTLDFELRQLLDPSGRVTILSGSQFRLLSLLVEYANRVLRREQLIELGAVRQQDANDRAIDLQVSRLRAKFGEQGGDLIQTVRHEGYVLAASVTLE